jgi:hypothetical protein
LLEDATLRRYERAFQVLEPPVLGQRVVVVKEATLLPLEPPATGDGAPAQQTG